MITKQLIRIRKLFSMILCFMLAVSFSMVSYADMADGTYSGTAAGRNGDVTVSVTVSGEKITGVEVTSQQETDEYWQKAEAVCDQIVEKGGTDGVDAVSGATQSSQAIIDAVNNALSSAVKEGFASGKGTEKSPYIIRNASQLQWFAQQVDGGNTYQGEYIALGSDIDISSVENWNPIGGEADKSTSIFEGTFDGQNHSISGMTIRSEINETAAMNYGLFSILGKNASVKNVSMTDVKIDVDNAGAAVRIGSIAGDTTSADKNSAGTYDGVIGTLIDSCSAEGSISADSSGAVLTWAAGIAGRSNVSTAIINCWTDIDCDAASRGGNNSAYAGGITGTTGNNVIIANCASYGDMSAVSPKSTNFGGMAGGIVGMGACKLYNTVNGGSVTIANAGTGGHQWIGSIAGELTSSGMTKQSDSTYAYDSKGKLRDFAYYLDSITLKELVMEADGTTVSSANEVSPSQAAGKSTKISTYDGIFAAESVSASALVSDEFMQTLNDNIKETLSDLNAYGISGLELREWKAEDGKAVPAGSIWVTSEIDASIFDSGSGTEEDPYVIMTEAQLRSFALSMNDKIDYEGRYVALGADIDVSSEEWTPIGKSDYAFNGTFDGGGFTVSGVTIGSEENAKELTKEELYAGFFGVLDEKAQIRNLTLDNLMINVTYTATAYAGGMAGVMNSADSGNKGAVIDSCTVNGTVKESGSKGNQFAGGITGYQVRGAIINSDTDVVLSCIAQSGDLAEAGGLVGLNNRGLIANCYSYSDVYGSGNREGDNEGMAVVSNLVAVNAGSVVNCYCSGDTTTREYSTYAGMASGWVTGIGKTYKCWYDLDSTMIIGDEISARKVVDPVESIGTKVSSGVSDEGDIYTGGIVDAMTGFDKSSYLSIAEGLNSTFSEFPIDITAYGVSTGDLKKWICEEDKVVLGSEKAEVKYVQPECEIVPATEKKLQNGTWFGRSEDQSTVISITVENNEIVDSKTEVLSGESSGDVYDEAMEKAAEKAYYGDDSSYEAFDPSELGGGKGTESSPYIIKTAKQLAYLASAVNEDNDFAGVWFKLSRDIDLSGYDWKPIGRALNAEVNGAKKLIAAYPFRGNFDGADHVISNLTIGSDTESADQMTSGLFGLVSGSIDTNAVPDGSEQTVTIKNVRLSNINYHVSTRYETYAGGLVGNAQNGVYIDNCSVSGKMTVATSESFDRVGGIGGNILRGAVTNCTSDVEINAETGTSHVYAGGIFGLTNRATLINCGSSGDITGDSENNNKVHIGGVVGQDGGITLNCYAAGDLISKKTTTDVGGISGRAAGISVEYLCYYNTEAVQQDGNTVNNPDVAVGVNANDKAMVSEVSGLTASEMSQKSFADTLNENREKVPELLGEDGLITEYLAGPLAETGFTHISYYTGNELLEWEAADGKVSLKSQSGSSSGGSSGGASDDPSGGSSGGASDDPSGGSSGGTSDDPSGDSSGGASDDPSGGDIPETDPADSDSLPFTDVAENSYYYDAVLWAVKNNITSGTSATLFSPDMPCTRAQAVTFLWRAAGSPKVDAENPFQDIDSGAYYYDAVLWAVKEQITLGTSETTFSPEDIVNRAQVVTFLNRAHGSETSGTHSFTDVPAGSYYENAVCWAVQNKITQGIDASHFAPEEECTRAQIVTFLKRSAEI